MEVSHGISAVLHVVAHFDSAALKLIAPFNSSLNMVLFSSTSRLVQNLSNSTISNTKTNTNTDPIRNMISALRYEISLTRDLLESLLRVDRFLFFCAVLWIFAVFVSFFANPSPEWLASIYRIKSNLFRLIDAIRQKNTGYSPVAGAYLNFG